MAKVQDAYANRALEEVNMTAANALTYEQIRFGTGIFQGVALNIHKIEFHPTAGTMLEMILAADGFTVALTNRDDMATLVPQNLNVITSWRVDVLQVGAVVSLATFEVPHVIDWTGLPSGGILLPANPLFLAMVSTGMVNPGSCRVVIYFTFKQLADKDYLELLQTTVPANI